MRLALYSGGTPQNNHKLNIAVTSILNNEHINEIVLITTPVGKGNYAITWANEYFTGYGKYKFIPYFIDAPNTKESEAAFVNAKAILLTGGNTYYLLKYLKETKNGEFLLNHAKNNALMLGFSAGALVLTPTIKTMEQPNQISADSNKVGLSDLTGLSLRKHELFVHYNESIEEDSELRNYTRNNQRPIYALHDGDGILVNGVKESVFGNVVMFDNGEKIKISCDC